MKKMSLNDLKALYPKPEAHGLKPIHATQKGFKHQHKPTWKPDKAEMAPSEFKALRRERMQARPLPKKHVLKRSPTAMRATKKPDQTSIVRKAFAFARSLYEIMVPKKTVLISLMAQHKISLREARRLYRLARKGRVYA